MPHQVVIRHHFLRTTTTAIQTERNTDLLARDAQAKLALIAAQCLSIHLRVHLSVRDSLSYAYVRSIARREPRRLPACLIITSIKEVM